MEVQVTEFRRSLKSYLNAARDGEEIVITERGMPVAKLIGADALTKIEQLTRDGVISPPTGPKVNASDIRRIVAKGSVSEFISKQRR